MVVRVRVSDTMFYDIDVGRLTTTLFFRGLCDRLVAYCFFGVQRELSIDDWL